MLSREVVRSQSGTYSRLHFMWVYMHVYIYVINLSHIFRGCFSFARPCNGFWNCILPLKIWDLLLNELPSNRSLNSKKIIPFSNRIWSIVLSRLGNETERWAGLGTEYWRPQKNLITRILSLNLSDNLIQQARSGTTMLDWFHSFWFWLCLKNCCFLIIF